jgi:predicted dienelactone hydrolase
MKISHAALLASLTLAGASPVIAQPGPSATPAIAVQQAQAEDPGHAPIPVAIWAPATGTNLPLIVISHGTGAGAISHIDTAQALAAAGFVVVAPMHPGDNYQDDSDVGRPAWFVDRSRHVSRVIDFMLGGWDGRARLARNRVGIFGFSAGATTALIAIGGEPDLARVAPHCAQHPEFVCRIMASGTPGAAPPPQWTHDARIKAAVVAAPGLGFAFAPSGLGGVHVPVQVWSGTADQTVPFETNTAVVLRQLGARAEAHSVEGAVHLSFLSPCGPASPPQICQDGPGFDRAEFHRTFNAAIVAFFRDRLGGGAGS